MPKKYSKTRRSKRTPKRNPRDQSLTAYALNALKGYALTKLKNKLGLNTELKYVDDTFTTTINGTLGVRLPSTTIAQGLTVSTRQGDSVRLVKSEMRFDVEAATAATHNYLLRIIVIKKRTPGAGVAADILQTTTNFSSMINSQAHDMGYTILKDEIINIGTSLAENGATYWHWTYTPENHHMVWTTADTTGVPANLQTGALEVWWIANSVSTTPVLNGKARHWFVDN